MQNDNTIFQTTNQPSSQNPPPANLPTEDFLTSPASLKQIYTTNPILVEQNQTSAENQEGDIPKPSGKPRVKKIISILMSIFILIGIVLLVVNFLTGGKIGVSSSEKTTITYWGPFKDEKVMEAVIKDFEKENPNIKVLYVKQDINQYRERLQTRIRNGTGPDIFRFHNTWYPMFKNELVPFPTSVMSPEKFKSIYYTVAQNDLIKNGAVYGIPLEIDTLALFINTQLLQAVGFAAPASWVDFIDVAKAMTVKDTEGKIITAGAAMGTFNNVKNASDIVSLLILANNVDFNNIQAYSDAVKGALIFYTSFGNKEEAVWDSTLDPSQLAFTRGNLGMYFGYTSDYFEIKKLNPSLVFQIKPVPQLPNQNVTLASYWAEGVSVNSKHQKESLAFIKFLAKVDTAKKIYREESKIKDFGQPYARIDLADDLKNNPLVYPFILQAQNAASSPLVDNTYDNGLNQQLSVHLDNVLKQSQAYGYGMGFGFSKESIDSFIKSVSDTIQKYNR